MDIQQPIDSGLREIALFAGAGGGILGGKLLGWKTVCAVEINAYAAAVLLARQNEGVLPAFPIWDDVRTFDGRPWRGIVDVVSGGFPCQDISAAGKGAGIEGKRSGMWTEMARIIGEVRPRFAFVENSPMLTSRGLGRVLGDLAALGYDARWGVLGAVDAGAPHKRDRIWIVAHSEHSRYTDAVSGVNGKTLDLSGEDRAQRRRTGLPIRTDGVVRHRSTDRIQDQSNNLDWDTESNSGGEVATVRKGKNTIARGIRAAVSNADDRGDRRRKQQPEGSESARHVADTIEQQRDGRMCWSGWWSREPEQALQDARKGRGKENGEPAAEPDVGRVAHGVAARVDRLKAIGNGQVPAVAALAWEMLTA